MSELKISVLIVRENSLYSGEVYTSVKNFTLLLGDTGWTNLTSVLKSSHFILCVSKLL